jgi:hypothetical protein
MLDRSRLAATASALAASFAAVLAIGAFAGGSRPVTLTISATPTNIDLVSGRPVSVLRIASLTPAASGDLTQAGRLQVSLTAGAYLVCVSPPSGWVAAGPTVIQLPHWACQKSVLRTRPAKVAFTLSHAAAGTG